MAADNLRYKVKANSFEFAIDAATAAAADVIQVRPNEFHLIHQNRSVTAKILQADASGKHLQVEVAGQTFTVTVYDALDQQLEQMGFSTASTKRIKEIKAPMPGLVLSIAVQEGQAVKEGDRILILEAMKMENSILIHADATIKRIAVRPGQAVDKGQVLVELE
ncbi:MAG: acetyl-CoA carboxylase biotin carboxyl carrier protein subunit [Lacibacter sp.]|jgi:biotin carboxyl carrier protein